MNRFVEIDETVSDTQTGLMWTKNATLSDFPLSWNEALGFVRKLNDSKLCGHDDWKLPNRRELFGLMSHEAINPSLPPGHPFVEVFAGYYWTSTTCARLPNQAWYVHLGGARVFKGMKPNSYMVWPVRVSDKKAPRILATGQRKCHDKRGTEIDCRNTGQDGEFRSGLHREPSRFVKNAECVNDAATGLTWFENAGCHKVATDWHSAFDFIETINNERTFGHSDWRLPTIVELESLTDMGRHSPALAARHPFANVREFYWSSTTSAYDTDYAWVLYLTDGAVGVGYKTLPEFYIWPVRGVFA